MIVLRVPYSLVIGSGADELQTREREFFIDNLLVRSHLIIEMLSVDRPCAVGGAGDISVLGCEVDTGANAPEPPPATRSELFTPFRPSIDFPRTVIM